MALAAAVKAYVSASAGADGNDARVDALNTVVLAVAGKKESGVKELIEALGTYLTAASPAAATTGAAAAGAPQDPAIVQRQSAVACLSEVFVRLPTLVLSDSALHTVVTFYLSRLTSDSACVKELLHGLFALLKNHKLPTVTAPAPATAAGAGAAAASASAPVQLTRTPLAAAVLKAIPGALPPVQSLVQTARKFVYDILVVVVHRYPHELRLPAALGGNGGIEWVGAYMRAMDGEKDPRNLMNAFWLVECVCRQFPAQALHPLAAELFDITSCYFPISFRPPPNDPYGITGDDLRLALRSAFVATPLFGAHALPLCLEKLEASTVDVKVDALQTLVQCVAAYPRDVTLPFVGDIWQALGKEAFLSSEAVVLDGALEVVRTVWRVLLPDRVGGFRFHAPVPQAGADNAGNTLAQSSWVGPVLKDCLEHLQQPDSKMARLYAGRVLGASAAASQNACARVWHAFWPAAKQRLASPHLQPSQRQAVVELVSALLTQSASGSSSGSGADGDAHPLAQYASELLTLYSSALMGGHTEYRLAAIAGLSLLAGVQSGAPAAAAAEPTSAPVAASAAAAAAASDRPAAMAVDDGDSKAAVTKAPAAAPAAAWSLLTHDQLASLVNTLTALVLFRDADAAVRARALDALVTLSRAPNAGRGALVVTHTLPVCLAGVVLQQQSAAVSGSGAAAAVMDVDSDVKLLPFAAASAGSQGDTAEKFPFRTTASALDAVARLSSASSACCAVALPRLLELVHTHFAAASSSSSVETDAAAVAARAFVQRVLGSLRAIIASRTASASVAADVAGAVRGFAPLLLSLLVRAATTTAAPRLLDGAIVAESTAILQTIAQTLDAASQSGLIQLAVGVFVRGDLSTLPASPAGAAAATAAVPFAPFSATAPPAQWQLVPLFTALVGAYRAKERVVIPAVDTVIAKLLALISSSSSATSSAAVEGVHAAAVRAAIQGVAAIVNKAAVDSAEFKHLTGQVIPQWLAAVRGAAVASGASAGASASLPPAVALDALLWCTKALVMRAHAPSVQRLGLELVAVVASARDPALAIAAAHGFELIMTDTTADNSGSSGGSVLTRAAHATVAMLHTQRWFALVLPHLLTAYRTAAGIPERKADAAVPAAAAAATAASAAPGGSHTAVCLLLALSHLLRRVPRAVLVDSLPTTLPLLIQSLSVGSGGAGGANNSATEQPAVVVELWVSTLATFSALLRDSGAAAPSSTSAAATGAAAAAASASVAKALSADVTTLIPAVLALTTYRPAQRVRLAAVDVLDAVLASGLPYATVFPHRQPVLNALGTGAVADPKRAVRMAAVRCRNEWFVMTSGGAAAAR